jgi:hypothetical protein
VSYKSNSFIVVDRKGGYLRVIKGSNSIPLVISICLILILSYCYWWVKEWKSAAI